MNDILIIGGTNKLSSAFISYLLKTNSRITIITRSTEVKGRVYFKEVNYVVSDFNDENWKPVFRNKTHIHINLHASKDFESQMIDKLELIINEAVTNKISAISFNSHALVGINNPDFEYVRAKKQCEQIIIKSGIPWVIFRPSQFIDSLEFMVRGNQASLIGDENKHAHWLSVWEASEFMAEALLNNNKKNKIYYLYGPKMINFRDAMEEFCKCAKPGAKIKNVGLGMMKSIAMFSNNYELQFIIELIQFYENNSEPVETSNESEQIIEFKVSVEEWCNFTKQQQSSMFKH